MFSEQLNTGKMYVLRIVECWKKKMFSEQLNVGKKYVFGIVEYRKEICIQKVRIQEINMISV